MNNHGGPRPGSGRKRGSANQKTRALAEKLASEGITPLEYLLRVMRNEMFATDMRLEAAKTAAPYVHPRLAAIEHTGQMTLTHEDALAMLSCDPDEPDGPHESDGARATH